MKFNFLKNQYFWIILISDLILLYFIIKYSNILFQGFLLNDKDLSTAGVVIAMFIFKFIFDIFISIKKFKEK